MELIAQTVVYHICMTTVIRHRYTEEVGHADVQNMKQRKCGWLARKASMKKKIGYMKANQRKSKLKRITVRIILFN